MPRAPTVSIVTVVRAKIAGMNRYLVLVMRNPGFDVALVDAHRDFLASLRERGAIELAGGFGDRSGGAYLLRAASMDEAQATALLDPLHLARASTITVYEWNAA
jgi:uncharacterized protein YciI